MDIRKFVVGTAFAVGISLMGMSSVGAQESTDQQSGASTVLLKFEKRNVSENIVEAFSSALADVLEESDEMHVAPGGEVTIQEMLVTAGCSEASPDCLGDLKGYVDGDRMIFGSIKRSGDAYLFTFRMFDFVEKEFVRTVTEQTVEGDEETVRKAIPSIAEGFVYGDVGTLEVSVTGASGETQVYFDGEEKGTAPATLQGLPLGQHAVRVETADGESETELVILRRDATETVDFTFGEPTVAGGPTTDTGGGGPSPALGYSVLGVGVAGLAVGVYGQVQNARALEASNELSCEGGRSICNPPGDSPRDAEQLGALAEKRDRRVRNTAIFSTVGYSVGAIGLGAGAILLYSHYSSSSKGDTSSARVNSIRIQPKRSGVEMGVSLDF